MFEINILKNESPSDFIKNKMRKNMSIFEFSTKISYSDFRLFFLKDEQPLLFIWIMRYFRNIPNRKRTIHSEGVGWFRQ